MLYGLAAIDVSGRIADRTIIRALGWAPGTRLHIREGSGVIVVRLDRQGVFTVTGQGHLHLPSAVRHWCGLTAGDRVLLAANPPEGLLVVHPPAALDAMVVAVHAGVLGGGQE
ncbi:AbrB/MazE/SpoVT family DNA-binding domain-containing protein [Micromonospora sp. NBC_01638]|uniref:AbrB/MazE/SpoVT family DNA-binding domain-containing protein n=1 Tax=Micromonospora sp. NBC_01638 TaxID=2975982 RepID=UPI0038656514|nr:AbrB/MazE/SpoVT family DNA-binding domain-containing protein [Micromonospora sp. NBC_01638]